MNRRVDQKLHLARLALAAIAADPAAEAALAEAALFHLYVAYRAYLREIFQYFNSTIAPDSAQQAAGQLRAQQLRSADVDELVGLEQSGAWPAQLRVAYTLAASVEIVPQSGGSRTKTGIAVRDVSTLIDKKVLTEWLQQFDMLLQRQREHAQEW